MIVRTEKVFILSLIGLLGALVGCGQREGASAYSKLVRSGQSGLHEEAALHTLALGDSLGFAWDPFIEKDLTKVDPAKYRGYAEMVGDHYGAIVDNSSCPGEASTSFISKTGDDNGCRNNRKIYKMHYDWEGRYETQLDFMRDYLEKSIAAENPPLLVTLNLGGNDLLLIEKHCLNAGMLMAPCELLRLPFSRAAYGNNLKLILNEIYLTGYRGPVVFVTSYAPDYSDAIANLGVRSMRDEMVSQVASAQRRLSGMPIHLADGFTAFEAAAKPFGGKTCKTGLIIDNKDGTCDIHASKLGHELLAKLIIEAIEMSKN